LLFQAGILATPRPGCVETLTLTPRGTDGVRRHYVRVRHIQKEQPMRVIMFAMAAAFVFSGAMAVTTTVRAEDSKTIIRHDDGDKTVIKKKDDMTGEKKIIIHRTD